MNTPSRRVILALTAAIGLYVGAWAEFFPRAFYASFPGLGLHWVSMDGAYDEHLIRDVGSFYLALTAVSIAGMIAGTAAAGRIAGLGWTVFGVPHLAYHVTHLDGSLTDKAGNVITLGISAIGGIVLLFPPRRGRPTARSQRGTRMRRREGEAESVLDHGVSEPGTSRG